MHIWRFFFVVIVLVASVTAAQVPVTDEPRHRVVFEQPQLRVLDLTIPPGDTTLDHTHRYDIATVSISATETRTQVPGKPWGQVRPRRPLGNATAAEYTGKPEAHRIENVGNAPYRLFAVENLREGGWSTPSPLSGVATTLAVESRAFRVYDVRLVRETPGSTHAHTLPVIAVLVTGQVLVEEPGLNLKRLDKTGDFVFLPAGNSHYLALSGTQAAYVVEIEVK